MPGQPIIPAGQHIHRNRNPMPGNWVNFLLNSIPSILSGLFTPLIFSSSKKVWNSFWIPPIPHFKIRKHLGLDSGYHRSEIDLYLEALTVHCN